MNQKGRGEATKPEPEAKGFFIAGSDILLPSHSASLGLSGVMGRLSGFFTFFRLGERFSFELSMALDTWVTC
jgi:hypothetical protein